MSEDNVVIQKVEETFPGGTETQYFRYGGTGYKSGVSHYLESSCDVAAAVVEASDEGHIAILLKFVAGDNPGRRRIPFAVKGGGHATNPGFSSTPGLQIAMTRFNKIKYDPQQQTLSVGAGCLFDEVYQELKRLRIPRNVVGGSAIAGVGVGGYLLGGGYSLKTNQYGLAIDNIVDVDIVLPTGDILFKVSPRNQPELFKAIKGGGNNFGIITRFNLATHEQPAVWGGTNNYGQGDVERIKRAVLKFISISNRYPKAALVAAFRYYNNPGGVEFRLTVQLFYDGAQPPDHIFDDFKPFQWDSELGTGMKVWDNYADFDAHLSHFNVHLKPLASMHDLPPMAGVGENARGRWDCAMVRTYDAALIDEIEKQAKESADVMRRRNGKSVVFEVWPFVETMFEHATPSAWPHERGKPNGPAVISFQWFDKTSDQVMINQLRTATKAIQDLAERRGLTIPGPPVYLNTTLAESTTVKEIYRGNLPELEVLRPRYDPQKVMDLAGGFKIPWPS